MVISAFQLGGDISAELETYNENGSPVEVSMHNGTSATWTSYDYLKNLQGDILGICSVSGGGIVTIHAAYEYDPWGMVGGRKKVISYFCRNGVASVTPFPVSAVLPQE